MEIVFKYGIGQSVKTAKREGVITARRMSEDSRGKVIGYFIKFSEQQAQWYRENELSAADFAPAGSKRFADAPDCPTCGHPHLEGEACALPLLSAKAKCPLCERIEHPGTACMTDMQAARKEYANGACAMASAGSKASGSESEQQILECSKRCGFSASIDVDDHRNFAISGTCSEHSLVMWED